MSEAQVILTEEEVKKQAEDKAAELTKVIGVKVTPIALCVKGGGYAVGFLKEPPFHTQLAIIEKGMQGPMFAAAELLDLILLKEHSDPRISSDNSEHIYIKLGAVKSAYSIIESSIDIFKKK